MKSKFEELVEQNKGNFPLENPMDGHRERFLTKLEFSAKKNRNNKKWMAVAASIILIFSLYGIWNTLDPQNAENNTEMAHIDSFKPSDLKQEEKSIAHTVQIQKEVILSQKGRNTDLVKNTLHQLNQLEKDYHELENELMMSGNEKVIEAMQKNLELRTKILSQTQKFLNENQP